MDAVKSVIEIGKEIECAAKAHLDTSYKGDIGELIHWAAGLADYFDKEGCQYDLESTQWLDFVKGVLLAGYKVKLKKAEWRPSWYFALKAVKHSAGNPQFSLRCLELMRETNEIENDEYLAQHFRQSAKAQQKAGQEGALKRAIRIICNIVGSYEIDAVLNYFDDPDRIDDLYGLETNANNRIDIHTVERIDDKKDRPAIQYNLRTKDKIKITTIETLKNLLRELKKTGE